MSRTEDPWSSGTESPLKILRIREVPVISKAQFCSQLPLPAWCRTVHHVLLRGSATSIITEGIVLSRSLTHYVNQSHTDLLPAPVQGPRSQSLLTVVRHRRMRRSGGEHFKRFPSATSREGETYWRAPRSPRPSSGTTGRAGPALHQVHPVGSSAHRGRRPRRGGCLCPAGPGGSGVGRPLLSTTLCPSYLHRPLLPCPPRPPHTCARTHWRGAPSGRAGATASPVPRVAASAPRTSTALGIPRARKAAGRADAAARHGCRLPAGQRLRAAPRRRPGGPFRHQRLRRLPPRRAALRGRTAGRLGQRLSGSGGGGLEPLRALRRPQRQRGRRRAVRARGRRPLHGHGYRHHGPLLRGLRRGALRELLGHVCHHQVSSAPPCPAPQIPAAAVGADAPLRKPGCGLASRRGML